MYEAGLFSISLKASLVFDELKLSWRHDGSKNSPSNSALISARPSVEWHLFSYIKSSKTNLLREKFFLTWKWIIALDVLTNKKDRGGERLQVWDGKGRTGSTFKHKFVLKCNYNNTIINPHNLQWWGHPDCHVCSGSSQQSQTSKMRHESDNKEQKLRPS